MHALDDFIAPSSVISCDDWDVHGPLSKAHFKSFPCFSLHRSLSACPALV